MCVEGRSAFMEGGVGPFMTAASAAYSRLESSVKKDLAKEAKDTTVTLTSAAVKKRGIKVFEKIEKLVGKISELFLHVFICLNLFVDAGATDHWLSGSGVRVF